MANDATTTMFHCGGGVLKVSGVLRFMWQNCCTAGKSGKAASQDTLHGS